MSGDQDNKGIVLGLDVGAAEFEQQRSSVMQAQPNYDANLVRTAEPADGDNAAQPPQQLHWRPDSIEFSNENCSQPADELSLSADGATIISQRSGTITVDTDAKTLQRGSLSTKPSPDDPEQKPYTMESHQRVVLPYHPQPHSTAVIFPTIQEERGASSIIKEMEQSPRFFGYNHDHHYDDFGDASSILPVSGNLASLSFPSPPSRSDEEVPKRESGNNTMRSSGNGGATCSSNASAVASNDDEAAAAAAAKSTPPLGSSLLEEINNDIAQTSLCALEAMEAVEGGGEFIIHHHCERSKRRKRVIIIVALLLVVICICAVVAAALVSNDKSTGTDHSSSSDESQITTTHETAPSEQPVGEILNTTLSPTAFMTFSPSPPLKGPSNSPTMEPSETTTLIDEDGIVLSSGEIPTSDQNDMNITNTTISSTGKNETLTNSSSTTTQPIMSSSPTPSLRPTQRPTVKPGRKRPTVEPTVEPSSNLFNRPTA